MEKKKPSIEEILAMARKQGAAGKSPSAEPAQHEGVEEAKAEEGQPESAESSEAPPPPPQKPAAKPKPAPGEKPSVADVLAMARREKKATAPADAAKAEAASKPATPKPAAAKPAAPKPAAKPAAPAAKEAEPAEAAAARSTASILEAARGAKRGPKSKAEAGISTAPVPRPVQEAEPVKAKPKAVAPPMPPKPDYAKKPAPKPAPTTEERRGFVVMLGIMVGTFLGVGFTSLAATLAMWTLGLARFMFPNIITEPPSRFKVGLPADFPFGQVSEKFKASSGVWLVYGEYNGQRQIYALSTVCTHLGCTPNWLEAEQKFKCPCHGSGFYKDGINFEGPAPRPLERYAIRLAEDGQLEVDKSRKFQEEKGEWANPDSFVPA